MKRTIGFVALLTAATVGALAQDAKPLPAKTVREAVAAGGISLNSTDGAAQSQAPRTNLFFCPQGECLYYSGDWDCNSSDANALFDFDNPGIGISDAEVWVGIRPRKNATITGTSGNYAAYATGIGTNPTPVAVRSGITPGQGGKLVCSTQGTAVFKSYGNNCQILNADNYFVSKLAKACHLKARKTYYIDLTPQYNDSSTLGYLWDDDGAHANKQGWPEITDHSYFNSSSFNVTWEPTWGSGGACGGIGCSGFSISLTGKQQ